MRRIVVFATVSAIAATAYIALAQTQPVAPPAPPALPSVPSVAAPPLPAAPAAPAAANPSTQTAPIPPSQATAPVAPAAPIAANAAKITEMEPIVREVLMQNPKIIVDAIDKYRETQEAEAKEKSKKALTDSKDAVFNNPSDPVVGNPKGDVTLVEFFDYHCGYCKHVYPAIAKLIEDDKNLRVVFKEFPILSEDSELASKAALAVWNTNKDKYFAYHGELMKMSGKYDERTLIKAAQKLGMSGEKLKNDMKNPALDEQLKKNHELGQALGVRGTPAMVIGDELIPGAASLEDLQALIKKQREGKKP